MDPGTCTTNGTVTVTNPVDGAVTFSVTTSDIVGNTGAAVAVTWLQDTTPPVVHATILSTTSYVAQLAANVIDTTDISLAVSANEPVPRGYYITMARQDGTGEVVAALFTPINGTVHVPNTVQVSM